MPDDKLDQRSRAVRERFTPTGPRGRKVESRFVNIDVKSVRPPARNLRTIKSIVEGDALLGLVASIKSVGLIQPIVVTVRSDGNFDCIAGERRRQAVKICGLTKIAAIVIPEGREDEIALVENIQREDLHPLEVAQAMHRLKERHQYRQAKLAEIVGKSRSQVSSILRLTSLPDQIKAECTRHPQVSESALIEIARIEPRSRQMTVWRDAKAGGGTISHLRSARRRHSSEKSSSGARRRASQFLQKVRQFHHSLEFCRVKAILELEHIDVEDVAQIQEALRQLEERVRNLNLCMSSEPPYLDKA